MDASIPMGTWHRNAVLVYYLLAFGVVWAWVFAMVLPTGFPGIGAPLKTQFPLVAAGMALGPALISLALTGVLDGATGIRELARSLGRWRVSPFYHALALFLVPICALLVLVTLSLFAPQYRPGLFGPDAVTLIGLGAVYGLVAGGLEEIGWAGFAIRRLVGSWSVLKIGIVLGVLHGLWHFAAGYWGEGTAYGVWYIPYFVMCWILGLTGLRILIGWLYAHTRSTLLCQLAHASYTGGLVMIWPSATSPAENVLWTSAFALLLLAAVLSLLRVAPSPDTA
ncbi:MAG TPA: CPBP family intramembrane glutamic endopeptidase [Devosia sp.]|nr:CPBP family intramembrane glutamic endopeptidase [Devosia sp.]